MGQLGEAGNKMHATTPEKVSLLDGCDVRILGFAQIQAYLANTASGCGFGLPVVVGARERGQAWGWLFTFV